MPKALKKKNKNIRILQFAYIAIAFIWIILAKLSFYRRIDSGSDDVLTIPLIMFACALIYLLLAITTASLKRIYLYIGLGYTFLNIFLTITDQIGIWDVILFILYLLVVYFLFRLKGEFN